MTLVGSLCFVSSLLLGSTPSMDLCVFCTPAQKKEGIIIHHTTHVVCCLLATILGIRSRSSAYMIIIFERRLEIQGAARPLMEVLRGHERNVGRRRLVDDSSSPHHHNSRFIIITHGTRCRHCLSANISFILRSTGLLQFVNEVNGI